MNKLDLTPCDSSVVKGYHYEASTGVLTVAFPNGDMWQYPNVDLSTFESMIASPSIGAYFVRYLRSNPLATKLD